MKRFLIQTAVLATLAVSAATAETPAEAAHCERFSREIAPLTAWIDDGFDLEAARLRVATSRLATRRLTNREFKWSLLRLVGAESSRRDFTENENIPADAVEAMGFFDDARGNPLTTTHLEAFKQAALAAFREFGPFPPDANQGRLVRRVRQPLPTPRQRDPHDRRAGVPVLGARQGLSLPRQHPSGAHLPGRQRPAADLVPDQ